MSCTSQEFSICPTCCLNSLPVLWCSDSKVAPRFVAWSKDGLSEQSASWKYERHKCNRTDFTHFVITFGDSSDSLMFSMIGCGLGAVIISDSFSITFPTLSFVWFFSMMTSVIDWASFSPECVLSSFPSLMKLNVVVRTPSGSKTSANTSLLLFFDGSWPKLSNDTSSSCPVSMLEEITGFQRLSLSLFNFNFSKVSNWGEKNQNKIF